MNKFEFSTKAVEKVIEELEKAEEFIYMAVFQVHKKDLFEILENKLRKGVEVAIFTLPYDSINSDIRSKVTRLFENIKSKGAKLFLCKWNVGDPERTTTAIGHWYSYHGKFIVTEKAAIALSANFLQEDELDACLIFRNDRERIKQFTNKFNDLKNLFIDKKEKVDDIRNKILNSKVRGAKNVFEVPRVIESGKHDDYWIRHYPNDILNQNKIIKDQLYISPFDLKAREIFMDIIGRAKKYVYMATESFTDIELAEFLEKIKIRNKVIIKILTGGAKSMDYSDRVKNTTRKLLACNVQIKRARGDLHAKLLLTDNKLVIGSVNLNRINLGFKISGDFWRGNTETITICSDPELINSSKIIYERVFKEGSDITEDLEQKLRKEISQIFNKTFEVRTQKEAKDLLAKYILQQELKLKYKVIKICDFSVKLMNTLKKKTIDAEILILGLIVYWLSDRKQTKDEIQEKIQLLTDKFDIKELLKKLLSEDIIEKEGQFYKLNINSMI